MPKIPTRPKYKLVLTKAASVLWLFLVAGLLNPVSAPAQQVTPTMTALARAQNAHGLGDNMTALNSIIEAEQSLWNEAPLGLRNVAFVAEIPEKFGFYTPKVGEDFNEDVPLILYCEPIGYTQPKASDGTYNISIQPFFQIFDSQGNMLVKHSINPTSVSGHRTFLTEFMMVATINVRGLSPSTYTLKMTLTDNNNPTKTVEVEKVFNWLPSESAENQNAQ
ncbi:MAG: hypothetical protein LBS44_00310 [Deltaproteobacteria bacterium]|jgi:hypothetical protein|nr:hypothetical protein [Deltaproteobacteria bacterium]